MNVLSNGNFKSTINLVSCISEDIVRFERGNGMLLIHFACFEMIRSLCGFSLQFSSNIDVLSDGISALHLAASLCKPECIKVLVRAGANASLVNVHGQTALDIAMSEGHSDTIELVSFVLSSRD